jgi:hypothetical protein
MSTTIKQPICPQTAKKTEADTFEDDWGKAISGDEFVRRAHEHIKKLYALRDKQQAGN